MEELFTLAYYRDGCECGDSHRGRVLVAVTRDCPPQRGVTRGTHCPLYSGEHPIAIDCSFLLELGDYFPSLFQRQAPMPAPITSAQLESEVADAISLYLWDGEPCPTPVNPKILISVFYKFNTFPDLIKPCPHLEYLDASDYFSATGSTLNVPLAASGAYYFMDLAREPMGNPFILVVVPAAALPEQMAGVLPFDLTSS